MNCNDDDLAGMCFFGQQKNVAAISCLKKAFYLGESCLDCVLSLCHCIRSLTMLTITNRLAPYELAGPFEWIVSYNLGLLHLATEQYASAFHHFSSSINTKSDFAHTYMYLAVALAHLDDVDNASAAYEKALELDDDMMFRLNYGMLLSCHCHENSSLVIASIKSTHIHSSNNFGYGAAITLCKYDEHDAAQEQFSRFESMYRSVSTETQTADMDVVQQRQLLADALHSSTN